LLAIDANINLAAASAAIISAFTTTLGGFIVSNAITELTETIFDLGTSTVRAALTEIWKEEQRQVLFCDFVTYGYSYSMFTTWARNIIENATDLSYAAWANVIFTLTADYWDTQAFLGSLTPSNLCELNPCDDFNQPQIGIEFVSPEGSIWEHNPTYTTDITLRWTGGGALPNPVTVFITDMPQNAFNGVDYDFTPSSVTFEAGSFSGAKRQVSVAINNNADIDGTRIFFLAIDSFETITDAVHIGAQALHSVVIYDNDDVQLVVQSGVGANLHLVDPNVYDVDAVKLSKNDWRCWVV